VFDHEKQQIDLFVIGFDNHVWSEFWNDQIGWS
jgi:hypothetical protein